MEQGFRHSFLYQIVFLSSIKKIIVQYLFKQHLAKKKCLLSILLYNFNHEFQRRVARSDQLSSIAVTSRPRIA